jgi:DNA-binding CsgD family transcriptional regulator
MWPVIGREPELGQIAQARAAGAAGIVFHGPAGVGKSRLAREALGQAERDGALAAWVRATRSAATLPLGAFAGVIPQELPADDRFELLRGVTQAMRERAGSRPIVVVVDDGHLLDPISAALVLHLANTGAAFVAVTVRSGEPCPDAIVSLWKDRMAQRVELGPLSQRDTEQLVEAMLDGPSEQNVRHWVWETSRGNLLYVRELVLGAISDGALERVDGLWCMSARPPISESLVELISDRLAGLSEAEQHALELLALGAPVRVSELVELAGSKPLTAIEARGLISLEGAGGAGHVRLAQPLYGEAIRAGLGPLRAREIRLELAAAVQSRPELTPEDALRVARWMLDAGEPIPSGKLLDAASAAILSGDPELGGELVQEAVNAGIGTEAALVLARSHAVRNHYAEAEQVLAEAEHRFESQEQAVAYLEQRFAVLYWGLKRIEELRQLLDRARDWWPDDAWAHRLAPLRLRAGLLESLEGGGAIVGETDELSPSQVLAPETDGRAHLDELAGLYYSGRGREAHELAARVRPQLPLREIDSEAVLSLYVTITVQTGEGFSELDRWANAALQEAVGLSDHGAAGIAALGLAYLRLLEGRLLDGARCLIEAQLHQEQHDPIGLLAATASLQAAVAYIKRDAEAAEAALERCRAALRGERPLTVQLPYLASAEAWAVSATGDLHRGAHILLEAAAELSSLPLYAAGLTYEAMRVGSPAREIAPVLAELTHRCDGRLVATTADHAGRLAAGDGDALLATVDEFEQMGAQMYACEAAAQAAQLFVDQGRRDSARRAAARSRELFVEDQGRELPAIDGLETTAVELTSRESQLVELARLGLSNAEIAERLVLSRRTVESHMYRAMQKLGISDRRDL